MASEDIQAVPVSTTGPTPAPISAPVAAPALIPAPPAPVASQTDSEAPLAEEASIFIGATFDSFNSEIDHWFSESFVGTTLGQDVQTWNLLHRAKEDLKTRLAALIKEL